MTDMHELLSLSLWMLPDKDFCLINRHYRKMYTLAKVFSTVSIHDIKYHQCLWKGILFQIHKTTMSSIYEGYSRVTMSNELGSFSTMLGIPILQLKTKTKPPHKKK